MNNFCVTVYVAIFCTCQKAFSKRSLYNNISPKMMPFVKQIQRLLLEYLWTSKRDQLKEERRGCGGRYSLFSIPQPLWAGKIINVILMTQFDGVITRRKSIVSSSNMMSQFIQRYFLITTSYTLQSS